MDIVVLLCPASRSSAEGKRYKKVIRNIKKRNRPKSELMLSGGIVNLSKTIILGQEIGSVPIDDISLGFFFRMDIEFIEDHHLLVL